MVILERGMRWKALLSAASLALALAAGFAAQAETPSEEAHLAMGQALVQRNCGMCHAVGQNDASANATAPPFRELGRRYPVDNLAEALAEGILTGHPQMPEFTFSADEVTDIIAYLKNIQVVKPAHYER